MLYSSEEHGVKNETFESQVAELRRGRGKFGSQVTTIIYILRVGFICFYSVSITYVLSQPLYFPSSGSCVTRRALNCLCKIRRSHKQQTKKIYTITTIAGPQHKPLGLLLMILHVKPRASK